MDNSINVGDILVLKKPHACGDNKWIVTRVGIDIKLKCYKCGHEIMIERVSLLKKMKKKVGDANA